MTGSTVLRLEALSKSFGGLHAVSDLSFDVKAGTITSLIGGNGAGKTTAFNLITGNLAPDAGHIYFRDTRVDGLPPHKVARAGIARGFQELRLFNRLTATDNIEAAIPGQRGESILRSLLGGRALREEAQGHCRALRVSAARPYDRVAGELACRTSLLRTAEAPQPRPSARRARASCCCSTSRHRA